jgi:metallo-beta-lactamase family protein
MFQGKEEEKNHAPFGFDPKGVEAVVLSHAHLDHVGRLPRLFREGFRGPVYATKATLLLMRIVLEDALKVL